MAQDDSKYTKPGLRERIKKRITAGSKGGKPGQCSARKAQMVAAAYKAKDFAAILFKIKVILLESFSSHISVSKHLITVPATITNSKITTANTNLSAQVTDFISLSSSFRILF